MIAYEELLLEALLFENQLDYLSRKYPDVNPELIQQAIDLDRRSAEKLVFGLQSGVIDALGPDSVAAVADLDPFARASSKSESELEYDRAVRAAKDINPKYWQWIVRVRKADPNAQFDEGIFHYLEAEGLDSADVIDMPLADVVEKSEAWHRQQFGDKEFRGTYSLTPEKNAVFKVGAYSWVPVDSADARIEGGKMQNCIGSACHPSNDNKIFSLRNIYNNPHVSLSMRKFGENWKVLEIKGKQNKTPVAKYVKYILPFLEFMAKKNVDITGGYDFWRLPSPDLVKLIKYHKGPVTAIPQHILDIISDDELNRLALNNGNWNLNAYERRAGVWLSEGFITRLYKDTIIRVFDADFPLPSNDKVSLLKAVLKYSKLDEDSTKSLLEKSDTTRSITMMVNAKFNPDKFMAELKKVHPDDFAIAYTNYIDGIEAYPSVDSHFGSLLLSMSALDVARGRNDSTSVRYILISKIPTADLMEINSKIRGRATFAGNVDYHWNWNTYETTHVMIVKELFSRITEKNIDAFRMLFEQMVDNFPFDIDAKQQHTDGAVYLRLASMDIIYSVSFQDLRELYSISERLPRFRAKLSQFMNNISDAGDEDATVVPGTTVDVRDAAAFILNTDNREELLNLRRTTMSRGVKIMVDRKLARLNRINANARANEPEA